MVPYHIILADNHGPLRQGLRRILDEQPDLEITAEAGDGLDLFNRLRSSGTAPLIVILDSLLPNLPGNEAAWKIKAIRRETKVLILSTHEDEEYLSQALSSGAEGYLMLESIDTELLRAIETIREGKVYDPRVAPGAVAYCPQTHYGNGKR